MTPKLALNSALRENMKVVSINGAQELIINTMSKNDLKLIANIRLTAFGSAMNLEEAIV